MEKNETEHAKKKIQFSCKHFFFFFFSFLDDININTLKVERTTAVQY